MPDETGFWDDIVPRVDPGLCQRCADCAPMATCPASALRRETDADVPAVDEGFCFGCFACAAACTYRAIILPKRR